MHFNEIPKKFILFHFHHFQLFRFCIRNKYYFCFVKWITIILSLYLIALSNMPCADMEVDSAVHKTAQFSSEAKIVFISNTKSK